jgi:formylmethanofuran dehydrogenase subunit D
MTLVLCSKESEKGMASISFSGSHLAQFGFKVGCKVSVDISKGQIIVKAIDDKTIENTENNYSERRKFYEVGY